MKVSIFYSWQSDLPNNKNRSFIYNAIEKALKNIYSTTDSITEYIIDSDSRDEVGTPDLVHSIFSKIDACDIFIADISIINGVNCNDFKYRRTPNPNVLIELGYASRAIGWSKIICIYNSEHAQIEELPFDIRSRKPIIYDTRQEKSKQKDRLISYLETQIRDIIENELIDKRLYIKQKRTVDLAMQAILIDYCSLLYNEKQGAERYNYSLLLNSTLGDIESFVKQRKFLGFELFRNIVLKINEFRDFFQDDVEIYFLSEAEKKLIVKIIFELREYLSFLDSLKPDLNTEKNSLIEVISAERMNPDNPPNSYLLVERLDEEKVRVISGGNFRKTDFDDLLKIYSLNSENCKTFSFIVSNIVSIVNKWVEISGKYFIVNEREIVRS